MASTSSIDSQLQSIVASAQGGGTKKELRAASEKFEAMFLSQLLNTMYDGMDEEKNNPFSGGPAETTYRSMLNEQYAESIAKKGGIGLSDEIYKEMIKLQEAQAVGDKAS